MIGNRLSVLLLAAVVVLGVLAGWLLRVESQGDAPLAVLSTSVPLALATEPLISQRVPPLDELSETLERPLFMRSRRPPPVDEVVEVVPVDEPQEPAPTALSVELSAVVLESERQYALFRQTTQQRLLKVELGQEVEGWLVREIRADGVRLERGTQSQDLVVANLQGADACGACESEGASPHESGRASVSPATTKRRPRRPLRRSRQRPVVRQ